MEEEIWLVYSFTTNTILREVKFFQTLTKREGEVLSFDHRGTRCYDSGAVIVLSMGT
jgi:hypothetical protein